MLILGRPATYAKHLNRVAHIRSIACIAVAITAAAFATGMPGAFPSLKLDARTVVAVAVLAVALAVRERFSATVRKTSVGITSEKRVAKTLSRIGGLQAVVHGALLGAGGDADHVALGPVCCVVETKTGKGRLTVTASGALKVGRRMVPGDPIAQVQRQARALERICGCAVTPIVCVPDLAGPVRQIRGVQVCNTKQLPNLIVSSPRVMDTTRAQHLARKLHDMEGNAKVTAAH